MTDIAVPLTVRREVAMSRAVYEGRAKVEGIEGILVRNYQEALAVLEENKIAVIVDRKPRSARNFTRIYLWMPSLQRKIWGPDGRMHRM